MQHFPIFLDVSAARIVVSGGGDAALAKLRLLLKTGARIAVFASEPDPQIMAWACQGRIELEERRLAARDLRGATLVYAADEDETEDARTAALGRRKGAFVNIVDDLDGSDFITPAIVDRDPVTVAIGTEGAAPVLARAIKADLESRLSPALGRLARAGKAFRARVEALPFGPPRREFWKEYYGSAGPRAADRGEDLPEALKRLLSDHLARQRGRGRVDFVGAGPGDPELLTLKARKALDAADVVIHDRLVPQPILELARREALLIAAGKEGFGPSVPQEETNAMIVEHVRRGAHVVRLKSGDPGVFGRLDDEIEAVEAAGLDWTVVPGVTAASAATAALGQSLTKRGRNSGVRLITGHDAKGFAEHDWRSLARPGEVAAIYMGKRSARFIQGRLLMHGADPATPVSVVENASRQDQRVLTTTLATLPEDLADARLDGPALTLIGLEPRVAEATTARLREVAS